MPERFLALVKPVLPQPAPCLSLGRMNELVFEITQEADGGYCAECLTESIVTEGTTWDELRTNVREAVRGYFFDQPEKLAVSIRLHLVRDEVLAA